METDPKEDQGAVLSDSEDVMQSPPSKKPINHRSAMRELTGKAQTYLNLDFVNYYKNVGLFKTEAEWEQFAETLYKDLPTTFRISKSTTFAAILQAYVEDLFSSNRIPYNSLYTVDTHPTGEETGIKLSDKIVIPFPKPLDWYPNHLAWQFAASRKALRSTSFTKHLKHFLNHETETGSISRQEAVSMVPPLLLDVESHHKILDMCAAPGSKTCQLIEMLHDKSPKNKMPTGFVMANDASISRCYLLTHHVQRLSSPSIIITNYDASQFPSFALEEDNENGIPPQTLEFDRVLCDVPCTGDGTIRKNPSASSGWDNNKALKLFKLQCAIAMRAAQLLKVGGRMVYSTCSFNPIENEAVVAHLLRESQGSLKLLDIREKLPQLQRVDGITTWKVRSRSHASRTNTSLPNLPIKVIDHKKRVWNHPEDVPQSSRDRVCAALFPPSAAESNQFDLTKCARFFPHLQDTGGFFIAVIEKASVTHFQIADQNDFKDVEGIESNDADDDEATSSKPKKGERNFSDDPFHIAPRPLVKTIMDSIYDYYGVSQSASANNETKTLLSKLLVRSAEAPSLDNESGSSETAGILYHVTPTVYELVRRISTVKPKFIACGIRFVENVSRRNKNLDLGCDWRITAESLPVLTPHLSRRVIHLNLDDFKVVLYEPQPKFEKFSPSTAELLRKMAVEGPGVAIIHFTGEPLPSSNETLPKSQLLLRTTPQWIMGWVGSTSLSASIKKLELQSWKNMFLTTDYSFEFKPSFVRIPDEEKLIMIEANRAQSKQKEAARKEQARQAKLQRREERRALKSITSLDNGTSSSNDQ